MNSDIDVSLQKPAASGRARLLRFVVVLVVLVALFAVLGAVVAPRVARDQLQQRLSAALERPVTIESVRINPFKLDATVSGIRIGARADHAGEADLLTIANAHVDFDLASIWHRAPVIDRLTVDQPALALVRYPDQTFNVSDLVTALANDTSPAAPFSISNIRIVDGQVTLDDRPRARKHAVTNLEVGIPFLSDLPPDVKIDVTPMLSAKVDGHPVALAGETRPYDDPPVATLKLDLDAMPLSDYVGYVPMALPFTLQSGQLNAHLLLSFVSRRDKAAEIAISGTVAIGDLALAQRDGRPLVKVKSLRTDIAKLDPIGREAVVKSIIVDDPALVVARSSDGSLNLATLIPTDTAKPASTGTNATAAATSTPRAAAATGPAASAKFRFRIESLQVARGSIDVTDDAVKPAYRTTLSDVTVSADGLTNAADAARIKLAFGSDAGERATHEGTLTLAPLALDGNVTVTGVDLKRLYPYYRAALNLQVDEGKLSASSNVHVRTDGPDVVLVLDALGGEITSFKLKLPGETEPLWRFQSFAIKDGKVDTKERIAQLGDLTLRGAVGNIKRNAAGEFNYALLFKAPEAGATSGVDWRVASRKLVIENGALALRDEGVQPIVSVTLTKIEATTEGLGNAKGAKARVAMRAMLNKRGSVAANGTLTLLPFASALSITLNNAELPPLQPYITALARVVVTGGTTTLKGTVDVADRTPFAAHFKGDVTLSDVTILDEVNNADLLRWKELRLSGIDAATEPLAVTVEAVALADYYARLILDANGEFNLQQLSRERGAALPAAANGSTAPTGPTAAAGPAASAPPVNKTSAPGRATAEVPPSGKGPTTWLRVARTELTNGKVDFSDFFVRPNYSVELTNLDGTASTLVFDTPADISLKGRIENTGTVEINGRLNPFSAELLLDLKANARDIDLPALTPYSGKYAGYGIQKGKLSAEVSYKIENRKLAAQNRIILDQLTFGDRIESPQATKLPVRLAVALLKDRRGVIDINLPIGGSLDDPDFSVGGIVIQAIVNLIVKIITAPFTLLASLASHGEELSYVGFAPGIDTLDAAAKGKLTALAKALNDRPALSMEIAGRVDPETDSAALAHLSVERKIRQQKFNDLVKDGAPPASLDAVTVAPAEYDALLTRVYRAEPIPDKPTNLIGMPKEVPKADMQAALLALQRVDTDMLRGLANRRAQAAKDAIVEGGGVPAERVFLVAPKLDGKAGEKDAKDAKDAGPATRVDFALK